MMDKVKIIIKTQDGYKQKLEGDTLICFTVNQVKEFLSGQAESIDASEMYIGDKIPELLFSQIIGSLVVSFIEQATDKKMITAYNLHAVAQVLEAKSKELSDTRTEQEMKDSMEYALEQYLETMLSEE